MAAVAVRPGQEEEEDTAGAMAAPSPPPSLPVLVECEDGTVILQISELFAPPRHELER